MIDPKARLLVERQVVWMPGGVRTEIHLGAEDTGGTFCLFLDEPPPGWSLPAHLHRGVAETMFVLEGEFEVEISGQLARLGPGQSVHVPADVVHSGGNVGNTLARRLLIFSPGGMERFFLEAGASSPDIEIDPRAALGTATRHGWEFIRRQ